ncbi:hypothetical protein RugamoR64_05030 [Duganella rhizosphaerae]
MPSAWAITWTGFQAYGEYRPDIEITGTFSGVDANHNGVIERSELTTFKILPFHGYNENFLACPAGTFPVVTCKVDSFSYVIGGQLQFIASHTEFFDYPSRPYSNIYAFDSGQGAVFSTNEWRPNDNYRFDITPQTVMTVVPTVLTVPVPEPEGYAMLGAGLLLLAGLHSRRKKQ